MASSKKSATRVKATKPVPVLLKPVKLEYLKFFKALGTGAKDIALGQWGKVVADAVDLAGTVNLATTPEELAYVLLQRSITKALFELVGETNLRGLAANANSTTIEETIQRSLGEIDISLDHQFFLRPTHLEVLPELQAQLKAWLVAYWVSEVAAENISQRLPSHFQKAVTEEWRRNASRYKPVLEALQSPFAKADDRELGWKNYDAYLQQLVEESVFEEPFSLSQIFVPLNAYYLEEPKEAAKEQNLQREDRKRRRVVVSLEQELLQWAEKPDKDDLIRVISGGPGSGKSSFARIFAAKVSQAGKVRVLFVPLHLVDATKDLPGELARYVQDEGFLTSDPLDPENPEPNLLVILDGLDELATQGRVAAETARAFVREVERTLERKNKQAVRLRILLSGRELVVQDNESEFRRPRQLLNLLPYHLTDEEGRQDKDLYHDPDKLLQHDFRQDWWKKYGELTGNTELKGLPMTLQREGLNEVTSQPLLNYLVALSYTRGKVKFDHKVNLNLVYADLVEAVHEGGHNRRRHASIRDMELADFKRVLEEIALAAWHGDGRTTTVREIQEHCQASNLGPLLEKFQKGAEAGVTRLLAAFFFRRQGQRASGDATFVFTHKSFGEYLTACRLVRAVERMVKQLQMRKESVEEGWHERDALAHWASLCGPSACTRYIRNFIHGEFRRRAEVETHTCRTTLANLFSHLIAQGIPMEKVALRTFPEALYQSRNAEETLLVALNATAVVTETLTAIHQPEGQATAFGTWFRRIQGQRAGPESCLAAACLSFISLPAPVLFIADFYSANLYRADFRGLHATFCNLAAANLENAQLADAELHSAMLNGANLRNANLQRANLRNSNLDGANLEGANLEGANLEGANLERAVLKEASLEGANVKGTILKKKK